MPASRWPIFLGGLGLTLWAYLPTLEFLADKWANDPQYSHGFLVPLFSAFLLYRVVKTPSETWLGRPAPITALLFVSIAGVLRAVAGGLLFYQLDAAALLLTIAALVTLVAGWRGFAKALPALLFLCFMVPLPYEVERNVGGPLRLVATQASTFLLQTLGQPAIAEGNTILIDRHTLEVADACSGLKMLVTFAAFAVGAVLLGRRSWLEKLLVLLGIVPIAVTANVARIAATGVSYSIAGDSKATMATLHDVYGWLMMPAGLAMLGLQLWCLNRLIVRDEAL
jgi:exosortase